MHAAHYQHTFVLTGLPGLLLLALLLVVVVLGLVDLLAVLAHGVMALRGSGQRSTERQPDEDAAGLLRKLWAAPGKALKPTDDGPKRARTRPKLRTGGFSGPSEL